MWIAGGKAHNLDLGLGKDVLLTGYVLQLCLMSQVESLAIQLSLGLDPQSYTAAQIPQISN